MAHLEVGVCRRGWVYFTCDEPAPSSTCCQILTSCWPNQTLYWSVSRSFPACLMFCRSPGNLSCSACSQAHNRPSLDAIIHSSVIQGRGCCSLGCWTQIKILIRKYGVWCSSQRFPFALLVQNIWICRVLHKFLFLNTLILSHVQSYRDCRLAQYPLIDLEVNPANHDSFSQLVTPVGNSTFLTLPNVTLCNVVVLARGW